MSENKLPLLAGGATRLATQVTVLTARTDAERRGGMGYRCMPAITTDLETG
jgi:hypothetical protein